MLSIKWFPRVLRGAGMNRTVAAMFIITLLTSQGAQAGLIEELRKIKGVRVDGQESDGLSDKLPIKRAVIVNGDSKATILRKIHAAENSSVYARVVQRAAPDIGERGVDGNHTGKEAVAHDAIASRATPPVDTIPPAEAVAPVETIQPIEVIHAGATAGAATQADDGQSRNGNPKDTSWR